jgi:hypothetical protein
MKILPLNWYYDQPIDFEYKEYIFYAYMKIVDESFLEQKKLSPHLLHLELMINDMEKFYNGIVEFKRNVESNKYKFFENEPIIGMEDGSLEVIFDIVDFSLPHISTRIKTGNKILKKYKQILY